MKKRSAPKEEPEKIDEEEWNLKDVIFVEDSRNMPIGKVIKVDGLHTVVHFPLGKSLKNYVKSTAACVKMKDFSVNSNFT